MLDNPRVSPILEDLIGAHNWGNYYGSGQEDLPSFRLDHLNVHLHVKQGHKAEGLHGGNFSSHAGGSQFFRYHDGHFYVRVHHMHVPAARVAFPDAPVVLNPSSVT